jgi:hypothetical protein
VNIMGIEILFQIMTGILVFYIQIMFIILLASLFRKKLTTDQFILPLDLIDAQKVTDMVDEKVESYIAPLLRSKGYSEEQIEKILTTKPLGSQRIFKR